MADHLRHELTARGWTQRELADRAGMGEKTVNDLLSGRERRRIPNTVPKVEQALGWQPGRIRALLEEGGNGGGDVDVIVDSNSDAAGIAKGSLRHAEVQIWACDSMTEAERRELINLLAYLRSRDRPSNGGRAAAS